MSSDNPDGWDWVKGLQAEVRAREGAAPVETVRVTPTKIRKQREHFAMMPMAWWEKLDGASGRAWQMAWYLLYKDWKDKGGPVKLPNGMANYLGIQRRTKWRALAELERRGLVAIDRRPKKSPLVQCLKHEPDLTQ